MTWPAVPQSAGASGPRRQPTTANRWRLVLWGLGIVLLLTGTFLPWLQSGRVAKNSYQLAGVGRRTMNAPDWVEVLLGGWPFLGPVWAVVVVLMVLRLRRTATWASIALALPAGLVAGAVLVVGSGLSSAYLAAARIGPMVTAAGAVMVIGAAIWLLLAPSLSGPVEPFSRIGASR